VHLVGFIIRGKPRSLLKDANNILRLFYTFYRLSKIFLEEISTEIRVVNLSFLRTDAF
jgi:hypothetical protein